MTHHIQYAFEGTEVRVVMISGEPWFVASDVCAALSLPNTTMALSRLDADEQALISIEGISRGNYKANVVNEPGLYTLVLGSRKPEAKRFKRWVTHEVLPALRKHGAYVMPSADPAPEGRDTEMASHIEADRIVSAGRVFTSLFRTARTMGMNRRLAATRANQAAQRSTGVDMAAELGASNWLDNGDLPSPHRRLYELQQRIREHLEVNDWPQTFTGQQLIEALGLINDRATQTAVGQSLALLNYRRVRLSGAGQRPWGYVLQPRAIVQGVTA
ncbi:TPA: BRO-N domain-containing protein [Pseudomonas aeruginosa]